MIAVFVLATMAGPAADGGVSLTWHGAPGCDDALRAQQLVTRMTEPTATGQARVELSGAGEAWTAEVTVTHRDETTHRTLTGPCEDLTDAAVLVIAVSVDALATTRALEPAWSSPVEPELVLPADSVLEPAATVPTTPSTSTRADRARARPALSFGLQVGGGGTIGLLPGIGGRIGGGALLAFSRARVVLSAVHEFRRRIDHPEDPDTGADVSLTAGRVALCWSPRAGRVTFPICGGVEAGAFVARGVGLDQSDRVASPWLAVLPHAEILVWAPRWLGFGPSIELPISVLRPTFTIDDFEQDLVRVGPAGLRFGLVVTFILFDEDRRGRARGGRRP